MEALLSPLPQRLLPWFREHQRDLPWRRDREPYHVWLSEIMLQQTRVEAVKGYYARFLDRLPNIASLAAVEETELLKLWEGLGYYNRARNLQKAAKVIAEEHGGQFPRDYAAIRALPGIGDYTAGAISSICFDEKTPAVDGNVLRVVSRFLDDHSCTDDPKVKKRFSQLLQEIYPQEAGAFTQSLMELGAMVCVPNGTPLCHSCPLNDLCQAKKQGTIDELPVRAEKKKRRQEELTVLLCTCGDRVALRRRPQEGLLAGLFEFPNLPGTLTAEEIIKTAEDFGLHPEYLEKLVGRKHIFTHIQWNMTGARLHCGSENPEWIWVSRETLRKEYVLPTAFRQFVGDIWEETP
jgi:A/G-specific adenine glycosylase